MAESEAETALSIKSEPSSSYPVPETESESLMLECESCSEKTETDNLFKCSTCIDASDLSGAAIYYCDGCIFSHVKRGHAILDYKSLKPEICSEHKSICSLFCTSCNEIHCTKCVSKHANHNIMPLKRKALEIRSEIFQNLAELEKSEKCVRKTKKRLFENQETYRIEYEALVQKVSTEMDKIKQNILNRMKVDHNKVSGAGKESQDNLDLLLKSENDLRDLLSKSNGLMITRYPEIKNQVRTVKEVQRDLVGRTIEGIKHNLKADGFEATTQDFLKKFVERIEMPLLKNINEPESLSEVSDDWNSNDTEKSLSDDHYVYLRGCESIYSVSAVGNEVFVYKLQFFDDRDDVNTSRRDVYGNVSASPHFPRQTTPDALRQTRVSFKSHALGKYTCPEKIKQLLIYPHLSNTLYILTDQFDLVFDVRSNCFKYSDMILDRDKLSVISDCSHNQYAWNWETKTIYCTDAKIGGSFQCESKPNVKMSYYDDDMLLLVTANNDVVLLSNNYQQIQAENSRYESPWNNNRNRSYTPKSAIISTTIVKESVHKVKQIDAVSSIGNCILIWSLLTKNITILNYYADLTVVERVVPFECELSYFSLPRLIGGNNHIQCLVKAKVKTSQNKFEDKQVFMVRKVKNETL